MTPTARSLKYLRELGYQAEKVEQRLPIPGKYVTRDFHNCIDIIAVRAGCPILGVQATSHSNLATRVKKCIEHGQVWLSTSNTALECWAWRKLKGTKRLVLDRREIPRIVEDPMRTRLTLKQARRIAVQILKKAERERKAVKRYD